MQARVVIPRARERTHLLCHDARAIRDPSCSPSFSDDSRYLSFARARARVYPLSPLRRFSPPYRIVSLAHKTRPRMPRHEERGDMTPLCVTFTIGVLKTAGARPRTSVVKIQFAHGALVCCTYTYLPTYLRLHARALLFRPSRLSRRRLMK